MKALVILLTIVAISAMIYGFTQIGESKEEKAIRERAEKKTHDIECVVHGCRD